MKIKVGL